MSNVIETKVILYDSFINIIITSALVFTFSQYSQSHYAIIIQ